jgi:hypothetical protein
MDEEEEDGVDKTPQFNADTTEAEIIFCQVRH